MNSEWTSKFQGRAEQRKHCEIESSEGGNSQNAAVEEKLTLNWSYKDALSKGNISESEGERRTG